MKIENGIYLIYNIDYAIELFKGEATKRVYLALFKKDKNNKWVDTKTYLYYPQDYTDDFIVVLNTEVEKLIKIYENKGKK